MVYVSIIVWVLLFAVLCVSFGMSRQLTERQKETAKIINDISHLLIEIWFLVNVLFFI